VQIKNEDGQAMVEFALILPILLLILCGIIDFGWIFSNQLLADAACKEAVRYTAIHYYDSSSDDDQAIAAEIVAEKAPTLNAPTVTIAVSSGDDSVTVHVTSPISVITPLISIFVPDGTLTVSAEYVMRLE